MKIKRPLFFIMIAIILVIIYILFASISSGKNNLEKEYMLNDAKHMLLNGEIQIEQNKIDENSNITCLQIYGYDSNYKNSGNYVGSVNLSNDEPYIELSDGKYLVRGTMNNLKIIESNLTATTTCN